MSRHKYFTLVRRELQEHRALWMAPAVVAGLLLLTMLFGKVGVGRGVSLTAPPAGVDLAHAGAMALIGTGMFLYVVAAVVMLAYLLDCLFAERKDRSILFWKSLPVSDAETVLSKLFVAAVAVPLGVVVLALVMQPLMALVLYLRHAPMREFLGFGLVAGWPEGIGRLLGMWVFALLWYLPLAAYLMLASVLARRAPIVYAALPPLVLMMWEKLMFDTGHVRAFIGERVFPWSHSLELLVNVRGGQGSWWQAFAAPALWIGVAAGAGMLYTVIRLRRYRDDT